ncbi:MAG: HPr family phosphocarrier protein [Alphaproteobacteria bacterium]|nr:HPr family phosphocarrier protein [Alphaproteobacteria bacterium]
MKAKVVLNSIDRVKEFVNITSGIDAEMDLASGRYVIDAKSIMGIFSLDLSKPIQFELHSTDESIILAVKDKLQEYIVSD